MDRAEAKPRPVIPFRAWIGPVTAGGDQVTTQVTELATAQATVQVTLQVAPQVFALLRAARTPQSRDPVDLTRFGGQFTVWVALTWLRTPLPPSPRLLRKPAPGRRRDKTRAIKQGMMQQLLTGRVRLVKPEIGS